VTSVLKESKDKDKIEEVINLLITNESDKPINIKIGKVLGYAEYISEKEVKGICTITEMFENNLGKLTKAISVVNDSGSKYPDISQPTPSINKKTTIRLKENNQIPSHPEGEGRIPQNNLSTLLDTGTLTAQHVEKEDLGSIRNTRI